MKVPNSCAPLIVAETLELCWLGESRRALPNRVVAVVAVWVA
jgi:hypothetical protein